jgi:hypothetical protein
MLLIWTKMTIMMTTTSLRSLPQARRARPIDSMPRSHRTFDIGSRARRHVDARFAALWADPEINAAEADLDRRADAEIDAGAGFRGSVDELMPTIEGGRLGAALRE